MIGLWLPVVVCMAAIYYGVRAEPACPGPPRAVSDTVLHMAGYAGLALLTLRATSRGTLGGRDVRRRWPSRW